MSHEIAAVVAARNEEDRLAATLEALSETFPGIALIVADDASTDRTPDIAREHGAEVVSSKRKLGKGGANTPAAERALEHDPDVVILCDGDLAGSAARIKPLVEAVLDGSADIAVASFSHRVGGGIGVALKGSRRVVKAHSGRHLHAPLSGQRALTPRALRAVLPFAPGYGMETGMNIDALRAGLTLLEIPLELEHRNTYRTLRGFAHRGRQFLDVLRVYVSRR